MPQATKIRVNPQVLLWARKEAGFKEEDIAAKLHINADRYRSWEEVGEDIPLGFLKDLANYYKRQLAVFFLPTPPPKLVKPKDFRNLAVSKSGLSPQSLLTMRRAKKYLDLARGVFGQNYWDTRYRWTTEVESLIKKEKRIVSDTVLEWLRGTLRVNIESQQRFRGYDDAFKRWRGCIEKELGVFVFQFPMPEHEIDAFCYAEDHPPYAIIINSATFTPRKIFSLFHELTHIVRHESGICITEIANEKVLGIELQCNDFAGKFLIPDSYVYPINDIDQLKELARQFKVSREVYLRRNLERGFVTGKEFFSLLKQVREQTLPKRKTSGPVKPEIKSKSSRGNMFYNLVIDAVSKNKIDYTTAVDALGLSINRLTNEF
jgi:Zn-dependent peptidase ImmA (M78 family)/transcriptional regulator with XRE-family HTH domain